MKILKEYLAMLSEDDVSWVTATRLEKAEWLSSDSNNISLCFNNCKKESKGVFSGIRCKIKCHRQSIQRFNDRY